MRDETTTGLEKLDGQSLRLLRAIDDLFLMHGLDIGCDDGRYPYLLNCRDLDSLDFYENFPQLGLTATRIDPKRTKLYLNGASRPIEFLTQGVMEPARLALPSAACYAIYIENTNRTIPQNGIFRTTVGTCFRNEESYDGLRRLLGFSMRELVYIGNEEIAKEHLVQSKEWVLDLCGKLKLKVEVEVATDPFFDMKGSKALMQRMFPVKEEFIVNGLSVGSVNYHRNFFGERRSIRCADTIAHTSCLAFGLERWVHTLINHFGDVGSALSAISRLS